MQGILDMCDFALYFVTHRFHRYYLETNERTWEFVYSDLVAFRTTLQTCMAAYVCKQINRLVTRL